MPFGLTNAPATFQRYINEAMRGILDNYYIIYLDNILIFSQTEEEHERHVHEVLRRLEQHDLYVKLSKCNFHEQEVNFLGFIMGQNGIRIDPERSRTVADWPVPASFNNIQVFLSFTGYFRRFIHQYSRITVPLTNMLKGMQRGRKSGPFQLTPEALTAFNKLKVAFDGPPVLRHYDPLKPILLITNTSRFAIAGILLQPVDKWQPDHGRIPWQPVAFYSQKLINAETQYKVHDQELLAIVQCFKVWQHYLEGVPQTIRVQCNHNNLKYFFQKKTLDLHQARWAKLLAAYDFQIKYKPGVSNPADAPS
jgi:hypothetical protein